jgi:hypothetical protein
MQSNTCRLFFYPSQGSKETREGHCDSEFRAAGAMFSDGRNCS